MADHKKLRPDIFAHYRGEPNDPWLEDTRKQIAFLFDAANINCPPMFVNYIAWSKIVLIHAGVPSGVVQEKLEIDPEAMPRRAQGFIRRAGGQHPGAHHRTISDHAGVGSPVHKRQRRDGHHRQDLRGAGAGGKGPGPRRPSGTPSPRGSSPRTSTSTSSSRRSTRWAGAGSWAR